MKKETTRMIAVSVILGIFIVAIALFEHGGLLPDFSRCSTLMAQTSESIFGNTAPVEAAKPIWSADWSGALNILATLILTSILSGLISYRRRGGGAQMEFTEAHIILSISAAMMMMIIGSQIARAFGLMGAASIVRYRYSLKSPKEASSLVIALGIGMACGVGLYPLAIIVTLFMVIIFNLFENLPVAVKRALFPSDKTWILKVRVSDGESGIAMIKEELGSIGVDYKIRRVFANKGPEKDQAEIEAEVFGRLDRSAVAEELSAAGALRVSWKQRKADNFYDMDIEE